MRKRKESELDADGDHTIGGPEQARSAAKDRIVPFVTQDEAWSGSLQPEYKRCGKRTCRCSSGELHGPYWYYHWRENGRQRKLYVPRDEVAGVLDACRDADERIRDADRLSRFGGEAAMGHDRRMLDQALDAAEAFGKREDLHALEDAPGPREVAVEFHGDHAAEGMHLPPGEGVLGMAGEPGIDHPADVLPLLQPFGDGEAVL